MTLLARYIGRTVIGYTLLVAVVLLVLNALYMLISQQDEIGTGSYNAMSAMMYVALRMPQASFDMLPIASLIGALLALGNLARSLELVVVRAAGVSVARISLWVFGAGLILMALTWTLGEYVAPPLEQYARQMKILPGRAADVFFRGLEALDLNTGGIPDFAVMNPKLEALTELVEHYGWPGLAQRIDIRCFSSDPSIKSSLTFLRKTPWARDKVEALYVQLRQRKG